MSRRFKPPWSAERIQGGYVVKDATARRELNLDIGRD